MRVFLHLHECGTSTPDTEGHMAADLEGARQLAVVEARSIMSAEVREGRLCLSCRIDIEDEYGKVLAVVPFKDAISVSGVRQAFGWRP